nr:urease [Tanacetum cinerariifolium]
MEAISIISSGSQAMGRIGEVICRTWQTAPKMKFQRGSIDGNIPYNDNLRIKRFIAKYTINPAIANGISDHVGKVGGSRHMEAIVLRSKTRMVIKGYNEAHVLSIQPEAPTPSLSSVSAIEYANANGGIVSGCLGDIKNFLKNEKLDQVLETVKSCTLDVLCDLTDKYKLDEEALNLALEEAREASVEHEWLEKFEALGSIGALKVSTHPVIAIFLYPLGDEVEAACGLEVKVEATCLVGALDLLDISLNIIISAS